MCFLHNLKYRAVHKKDTDVFQNGMKKTCILVQIGIVYK